MATIKAFRAIRPQPDKAADVAALPYDVYNRAEAALAVQGKPLSFLRIDRPETTMAEDISIYDPAVYEQAKINFTALTDAGVFLREEKPCLYIYELTMDGRTQTGLVSVAAIDDYLEGVIKKHENTRDDKAADRIRHVDALAANTGPIFLTYRHRDDVDSIIRNVKETKQPIYDFTADDGVTHRVWIIDDGKHIAALEAAFAQIPALYIADGHHRAASAVTVGQKYREKYPEYTGEEPFNYFLNVAFPDNTLHVMDYNRVVADLNGLDTEAFLSRVSDAVTVQKVNKAFHPEEKGTFAMFLDNQWYMLKAADSAFVSDDPVKRLDVSFLQDQILAPILGIADPKTDSRIDFVGGIRGLSELERRCRTDMRVAFALYPTSIDELMQIADAGKLMPPKSTWFEPKLRSGLFIHSLI